METHQQYKARIVGLMEGKDPISVQRETPARLTELMQAAPAEKLSRRPAADRWSVGEILAHLSEAEITASWRYRQMLEHDNPVLLGFDQEKWAELGDYRSWTAKDALETFRLLREANLRMLHRLTPEEWKRPGQHIERGRITVRELARHMAAHDINHIKQIEALLA